MTEKKRKADNKNFSKCILKLKVITVFQIRDGSWVNDQTKKASWPDRWHISFKLNMAKKLVCGLGDPSDGLHDPPLEIINWNAE